MDILYDKTGREVGRSCLETEKKKAAAPVAATADAATVAAASTKVIPPTKKKVVPVEKPKPAAAATPTKDKAGCAWWPWLLLLLIPFLFCFFTDWCQCADKTEPAPPPPVEEVVPPAPEQKAEAKVEPAAPVEITCNCSGNSISPVFNVPTSRTPKSLSRLGTNPEFGNSHSLDGAGFYNKLKAAHNAGGRDRTFLDSLFKGMGYNGFSDATADMFSETRLRRGQVGNIGASKKHRTVYAKLDVTSDRDLMAFKIDAKNGCDVHFMKTCGNHFFFCPN